MLTYIVKGNKSTWEKKIICNCSIGMVEVPLTYDENEVGNFKFTFSFTFYYAPFKALLANNVKK